MQTDKGQKRLRKGRVSQHGRYYSVTICAHEKRQIFRDEGMGRVVIHALQWLDERGRIGLVAAVVMPEHVHMVLQLKQGTLSEVIKSLKGYTARRINRMCSSSGRLWQPQYYDRCLRSDDDLSRTVRYVLDNPVRRGIVAARGDYRLAWCVYDSDRDRNAAPTD